MQIRVGSVLLGILILAGVAGAQEPPRKAPATLNQLMKGVLFPNSNVIFEVQDVDPAAIEKDPDGSASTSLSKGIYGGWQGVENAALALSEAATNLIVIPRQCDNGRPAPVQNADWIGAARRLADLSQDVYEAAKARDKAAFETTIADRLVSTCAACHDVYRDRIVNGKPAGMAGRCTK